MIDVTKVGRYLLWRCKLAATSKRWSRDVTENSNALDLESNVFTKESPRAIAQSLKRSAEHSKRRRSDPYRSAMSMLTFYINRAGKNLPQERREPGDGQGVSKDARAPAGRAGMARRARDPRSDEAARERLRRQPKTRECRGRLIRWPRMPASACSRGKSAVVGRARFELAVSWSQTRRFSELSYRPSFCSAPDSSSARAA